MILLADSEDPDQTALMRSLIWAFAVRVYPKTCFLLAWSIYCPGVTFFAWWGSYIVYNRNRHKMLRVSLYSEHGERDSNKIMYATSFKVYYHFTKFYNILRNKRMKRAVSL